MTSEMQREIKDEELKSEMKRCPKCIKPTHWGGGGERTKTQSCSEWPETYLPPAYVVRREVMFSQVCVCSTFGGGGYPRHMMGFLVCLSTLAGGGGSHLRSG